MPLDYSAAYYVISISIIPNSQEANAKELTIVISDAPAIQQLKSSTTFQYSVQNLISKYLNAFYLYIHLRGLCYRSANHSIS